MSNCHKNFLTSSDSFHSKITLDGGKIDSLRKSARNLRAHIKTKFKEKKRPTIKFQIQGSMAMKTTLNPLNSDYDIDDGLYFIPQLEERPTPATAHAWVVDAASSYKNVDPPIDKERCIRVPFKAGYHIDIPIYDLVQSDDDEDNEPFLAVKNNDWEYSDPRKLTDWFTDRVADTDVQLRRLVRYFKAWADFQNTKSSIKKMPSGLVLTILAAEEYQESERDDESFANTAKQILDRLKINEKIYNPVDRKEDLRKRVSNPQFENFLSVLDKLVQEAESALNHESAEEAARKHWQKVLGDRFPILEDDPDTKKKKSLAAAGPGLIQHSSKSA